MIINKPCSELDNLVTEILQDLIFEQQNKPTSHSRAISDITTLDFIVGQISGFLLSQHLRVTGQLHGLLNLKSTMASF